MAVKDNTQTLTTCLREKKIFCAVMKYELKWKMPPEYKKKKINKK